jgi:hypothetical protein
MVRAIATHMMSRELLVKGKLIFQMRWEKKYIMSPPIEA